MASQYLRFLGWAWVACLSIAGAIVLAGPFVPGVPPEWFSKGQGVALQLIGAGILFAAVFSTLAKDFTSLIGVAGVLTAIFGYVGTMLILADENPTLLVFVFLLTVYPALISSAILMLAFLMGDIFNRSRR